MSRRHGGSRPARAVRPRLRSGAAPPRGPCARVLIRTDAALAPGWGLTFELRGPHLSVRFDLYAADAHTLAAWLALAGARTAMSLVTPGPAFRAVTYRSSSDTYTFGVVNASADSVAQAPRALVAAPLRAALLEAARRGLPFRPPDGPAPALVLAAPPVQAAPPIAAGAAPPVPAEGLPVLAATAAHQRRRAFWRRGMARRQYCQYRHGGRRGRA